MSAEEKKYNNYRRVPFAVIEEHLNDKDLKEIGYNKKVNELVKHQAKLAKKAKLDGFRSRAVYKIIEIDQKVDLFKNVYTVLDIGSAPGGWSEYAAKKCPQNDIFAIDLLDMKPVKNVSFFKSDIREIDQVEPIFTKKGSFDLVISDLAPNITGIGAIDDEAIYEYNTLTLEVALKYSNNKSKFLIKTFQNSYLKKFKSFMEKNFTLVQNFKPLASKATSSEIYLYGEN